MPKLFYQESGYCVLPGDLENVADAASLLKAYCQKRGIDEAVLPELELAFCEALNNAIEHGCGENPAKQVELRWTWEDDCIVIKIKDPGNYEPPAAPAELPEDPLDESGRGQYIIRSVFDEVSHENSPLGHRVTLRKKLHPQRCMLPRMLDMYQTLQSLSNETQRSYALLDTLQGFASDLAENPVIENTIRNGVDRLRALIDIPEASVWLAAPGRLELAYTDGAAAPIANDSNSVAFEAILGKRSVLISDSASLDSKDPLRADGFGTLLCPMVHQKESLGLMAIRFPSKNSAAIDSQFQSLAESLALFLGIAYASLIASRNREEQERSKTQLEVASEIQRSLLPSHYPSNEHCRVTGKCVTALEVGGDYIDAIEIRDYGLLVVIADVMGKGVPAALLATIFRTAIRSRLNFSETPGWLLSQINKQIHEELGHLNLFITAQAAFYNYEQKKVKLASAGHCPVLLQRSDGSQVEQLNAEGLPLGIDDEHIFEERLIKLDTGDRLLFITDGLYEVENDAGCMLGIDGFAQRLNEYWKDGFESVPDRAFAHVAAFAEGRSASDDKTLLALEIL